MPVRSALFQAACGWGARALGRDAHSLSVRLFVCAKREDIENGLSVHNELLKHEVMELDPVSEESAMYAMRANGARSCE